MIYLIALLIVAALGGCLFLVFKHTGSHTGRVRRALAQQLDAEYRQFGALDKDVLEAGFSITHHSQFRHTRHQLLGQRNGVHFKVMDYAYVGVSGLAEQTVIVMDKVNQESGDFRVQPQRYHRNLQSDSFTDPDQNNLQTVAISGLPNTLVMAQKPHAFELRAQQAVCEWLQRHPDMVIEQSQHLLMIFKPGRVLVDADAIMTAIDEALGLFDQGQ